MKKCLIMLWGIVLSCQALAQMNTCTNPLNVPVNSSPCNASSSLRYGLSYALPHNADSIYPSFYDTYSIKPKRESWFKFRATSKNIACRMAEITAMSVYLYSDSCAASEKIFAFSTYLFFEGNLVAQPSVAPTLCFENLNVGQTYYIRLCSGIQFSSAGQNFAVCLFNLPDEGQKVISTPTGGDFFSGATWLGGRTPGPLDTVVIADGSTVNFRVPQGSLLPYTYSFKGLHVGQGQSGNARLIMNNSQTTRFFVFGDMTISEGDTLKGLTNTFNTDDYLLYGNFRNNGVLQYLRSSGLGGLNTQRHILYFLGNLPQNATGTGQYLGCGLPALYISNPFGVNWNIQWPVKGTIFLCRGHFNNLVELKFDFDMSVSAGDAARPGMIVANGTCNSPFGASRSPYFSRSKYGISHLSFVYDSIQPQIFNIQLNRYIKDSVNVAVTNIRLKNGSTVQIDRNYRTNTLGRTNGILNNPSGQDTLFFYQENSVFPTTQFNHNAFSVHQTLREEGNSSIATWRARPIVSGRLRGHILTKPYLNTPPDLTIYSKVFNFAPSGPIQAPGTFTIGEHILFVGSNRNLNDSTRLGLELYPQDVFPGLPEQWRIIQATTPSGPWMVLETNYTPTLMGTRRPINLTNGNYFAFGSVGNANDANLTQVMRPWYGHFNCPGLIVQPFNLLVRNGGVAPITSIKGGVLINGQEYSQTYTPGNGLRRPIPPGQTDTLKVSIPSLPFGNYNMRFFVNMTNDAQPANDSISYTYNINPHAMGERIDFDTVNVNPPNFSFLTEAGRPYIEGWHFSTYDTANINRSGNSFFVDRQRGALYLSTWANARNGYLEFRTRPFGPLTANAHFSLDIAVFASIMRSSDTIYIEASDDCGQTYRSLETITRANQDEYISQLNVDQIQPPPTKRFPIPFPEGSHVHIRLLYRWPAGLPFSRITADNMWVGVPTGINQNVGTQNRLEVWPNPAGQALYARLPSGEHMVALQILDMQGKVLKTQSEGLHIKLEDINSGTYMARMVTNKGVRYARFVKE